MINILTIGDVVGRPGRESFARVFPGLKKEYSVDFCIVNGENAAAGSGLTPKVTAFLLDAGADVVTTGDHIWKNKAVYEIIDREDRLLRPANYPDSAPGKGFGIYEVRPGIKIGVINLIGRVFMSTVECPFRTAADIAGKISEQTPVIMVDIHAEATSEKIALAWYMDGKISGIFGTHTHVQTADENIFPKGTGYITDVGMTGPFESVLGRDIQAVLKRFITQTPSVFGVAEKNLKVCGAVFRIDEKTGKTVSVKRIHKEVT
ncbi:MAG: TIGR00282 family metallophosphoesterase [bacterium]|nr:TIGR00282 family metallophosphoesterase [bacterium]